MNRRLRKIWGIVCFTGIPWFIISIIVGIAIEKQWYEQTKDRVLVIDSWTDIWEILCVSIFICFYVLLKNSLWIGSKRRIGLFTWMMKYKDEPQEKSTRKRKAQYPRVKEDYLSSVPDQFAIGKQQDKFVQFDLDSCLPLLVFGSSGAGKTSLLLTMILYQLYIKKRTHDSPALFVFDFKEGELYRKSCSPDSINERFVSLSGRDYWGWDPYYRLNSKSKDDEVIQELTLISDIVIDDANEKNSFFTDSAKAILVFVGLYCFKKGKSFIQTIDYITKGNVKTMLLQVMEGCEGRTDYQKTSDSIAEFVAIGDNNEALNNIKMTLKQKMGVFRVDDVRWALEYNPLKASPYDLEDGKSIFFYPGDTDVTNVVLRIIAKQLEYHCTHRDFLNLSGRGELRRIITIADECFTIGKTVNFAKWASVARGYKNPLIMIWQSYSQVKETYNENTAESLLDDVDGIVVLAVNSPKNAEQFVEFAGEYWEERKTYNHGGSSDGTYSRSYENKPVLTKWDFLQLRRRKEAIIMMNGEYYRVKSKPARYYMIQELNTISEKCLDEQREREQENSKQKMMEGTR